MTLRALTDSAEMFPSSVDVECRQGKLRSFLLMESDLPS